jgi:hypothetical protein
MLRRKNYSWTSDDEAKLKALAEQGIYLRSIAVRLGRSESSIKKRAYDLGLPIKRMPRPRFRFDEPRR